MHNLTGLFVGELVPRLDFVEELATLEELHGDVDGVFGLEDAVELHDVFVVELAHEGHLV